MLIRTLWKQYPEAYPGELMPNIYEAVDEYLDADNPSHFEEKIKEAQAEVAQGHIVDFRIIAIEVPEHAILNTFNQPAIEGVVVA